MAHILAILGQTANAPDTSTRTDEVALFEERLRTWAAAVSCNEATDTIDIRSDVSDLWQLCNELLTPIGTSNACAFDVVILVGHGEPGILHFDRNRMMAARVNSNGCNRIPYLDATSYSSLFFRDIHKHLAVDGDIYLVACDLASAAPTVAAHAPGVLLALNATLALGSISQGSRVYFTRGPVSSHDAEAVLLRGEELLEIDYTESNGHLSLQVSDAKIRRPVPGLIEVNKLRLQGR